MPQEVEAHSPKCPSSSSKHSVPKRLHTTRLGAYFCGCAVSGARFGVLQSKINVESTHLQANLTNDDLV